MVAKHRGKGVLVVSRVQEAEAASPTTNTLVAKENWPPGKKAAAHAVARPGVNTRA